MSPAAATARLPKVLLAGLCAVVLGAAGCGGEIELDKGDQANKDLAEGADLFYERCSGCHSLEAANSYGSKPEGSLEAGERTNGPDFNERKENREDVLYAIRNGGFSGAIMPANIVTGDQAEQVATFLEKYSGRSRSGELTGGEGTTDPGVGSSP